MKNVILAFAVAVLLAPATSLAQQSDIEIKGDSKPDEAARLELIWLFPEDYESKTIKLQGFLVEPQNFEYFPDQNGYLFCLEAAVYGRKSFHPHIGNSVFLSRDKLNLFCSTAEGRRIREFFKKHLTKDDTAESTDIVLQVKKQEGIYFGVVSSFSFRERGNK